MRRKEMNRLVGERKKEIEGYRRKKDNTGR
jgi:hypothetical protein